MLTAPQLAGRYDAYVLALDAALDQGRRRVPALQPFMVWIEECWQDEAPPEPEAPPVAVSAGRWGPVRWHEVGGAIHGYVPGVAGCYDVTADNAPPALGRARLIGPAS